jgi:glycosyltransferase involved in cell wall biosynthesis
VTRVVVITPIPTPYRDPFWEQVARSDDVELTVVYCSHGRADRPWDVESNGACCTRLFPKTRNLLSYAGWGASCYWTPDIKTVLADTNPDIVLLGGYNHITMLSAARYCRDQRVPYALMCETWRTRHGLGGRVKHALLRRWLRHAAGALPTGTLAADYLLSLGVPSKRQCLVPNIPDIETLRRQYASDTANQRMIRRQLDVAANNRIILYAARMVEKKRPSVVVDAFSRLDGTEDLQLVMLGDGPLLAPAKEQARSLKCIDRIRFTGFVEPREVHEWMSISDVFVQPSSETWGVAPVESLACGCPVILSRDIGCHADILSGEEDGIVLDVVDASTVSAAMSRLLNGRRRTAGRDGPAGSQWIQNNGYEAVAQRLRSFLRHIIEETSVG